MLLPIMRKFYLAVLILYFSNHLGQCSGNDDFVDPLDMLNYDRATKSMKRPKTKSVCESVQIDDRCPVFVPRFINLLLKTTGLDNVDPFNDSNEKLNSYASVTISVGDLQALKNMAAKKNVDYDKIDEILKTMFTPIKKEDFSEFEPRFKQTNSFIGMEIKEIFHWILTGCIVIFSLYILFHYFSYTFSVSFFIFVVVAFAFASTWYTMYMKAEISRSVHLENMPSHCKNVVKTEGWFSWYQKEQNLDECKAYKEAIHINPLYSIALTEVFAEMFGKMMKNTIQSMGEALHSFNKSVFKDYPFWAKLILVPIVIVIVILVFIKTMLLSLALFVGRHLTMKSFFGHGSTTIGPEQTHTDRSTTTNKTDSNNRSTATGQHTFAQMPQIPGINFNINLYHPNSDNIMDNRKKLNDDQLKLNFKKNERNFISMLKNEDNDCVDNTSINDLRLNKPRSRTLSI